MEKIITVNTEVMNKFTALVKALGDCGISASIGIHADGDIFLSAPLWNCEDGSGEIFEVFTLAKEDFEIGHAVSNTGRDYDEVCENLFEIREEF